MVERTDERRAKIGIGKYEFSLPRRNMATLYCLPNLLVALHLQYSMGARHGK